MKKILLILIIPVFMGFKAGNDIDETKMNRDLEIAKNILATLVKSGSHSFFSGESIDASYIKGYGVVFTIPEHFVYFHSNGFMAIPELPPIPDIGRPTALSCAQDFTIFRAIGLTAGPQ